MRFLADLVSHCSQMGCDVVTQKPVVVRGGGERPPGRASAADRTPEGCGVWTFSPAFSRVRAACPGLIAERCLEGSRVASAHGWRAPNQCCVAERRLLHPARSRNPTASITLWPIPSPVSTTTLSSAPKAASPGCGWTYAGGLTRQAGGCKRRWRDPTATGR